MAMTARLVRLAATTASGQRPAPGLPAELRPAVSPSEGNDHRFATRALGPGLASARAARDFTRQTLEAWDLHVLSPDAAVIVSELGTNALLYGARGCVNGAAGGPIELILWQRADHLVCAITDPGSEPPVAAAPDPCAAGGRGLHVVQALATAWGWAWLGAHRKAVWAALSIPDTSGAVGYSVRSPRR
jgi:anti-sigma regulatory factor (Ser/Thr protein kinase)